MKWKIIVVSILAFLINLFTTPKEVEAQGLEFAGTTKVGSLYVDVDKTYPVKKEGTYFLAIFAEEKYTNQVFLTEIRKNEKLKDVAGAVYLYLFDNRGSSYCTAAKYFVDAKGQVCLDYGSDMKMKALTTNDTTMLNAYTLCLKALENKKRIQGSLIKKQ